MKLNYKRTLLIGFAFLSICSFWQLYDSIIPLILKNTFSMGETVTGAIMALDNVLALFLLPLIGGISDKADTRFGKRIPFVVVGTALAVNLLMLLYVAQRRENLVMFVIVLFVLLIAMGLYRSPAVALMPDLTPNALRSQGNAMINLMGTAGGIITLVMISKLVGKEERPDYFALFLGVAIVMVVSVVILILTIHEKKVKLKMEQEVLAYGNHTRQGTEKDEIHENGSMSPEVKKSMIFLLLSIFLWFTAYNAVTTAFSRYAGEVWGLQGGGFANALLVATVAAVISYIPIGYISARIGRKKTILIGIMLMSACYFIAVFAGSYHFWINIIFAIIGIGWAAINVNSYPMVVEMSKGRDIGKFTGTYYTFSMAAQVVTPILSGFLLEKISYRTLFPYAVFFSCAAFFTMMQVKHGDNRPELKKSVLENFDVDD